MADTLDAFGQVGFWTAQTGFAALVGTKLVGGGAQNAPGKAVRSGADWKQVKSGTLSGDVNAQGNAGGTFGAGSAGRAGNAGSAGKDQCQRIGASHRKT